MELRILYQDDRLIAVDKPGGLVAIPGRGEGQDVSVASLLHDSGVGPVFVVHRLDLGTSGVILFARDADAHRTLSMAFEQRKAEKTYVALVAVPPDADLLERTVDAPIADARRGRMRIDPRGKPARTRLTLVERFGGYALAQARPETGRTHQVRLHLAHAGWPLAVDAQYGRPGALVWPGTPGRLARTPLHAASVRVRHPDGKRFVTVESPLAADIAAVVDYLRAGGRVVEER